MPRRHTSNRERRRGSAFARRVKKRREELGLSQAELARRSGVGLDTLRAIEGERVPGPGLFTAADIVKALEGRLDDYVEPRNRGKSV